MAYGHKKTVKLEKTSVPHGTPANSIDTKVSTLQRYKLPALGVFLGAMGATTPLAATPAGIVMAFTGILGILTLWNSRGEVGASIRKRAFFTSLWVSLICMVLAFIILNLPAETMAGAEGAINIISYVVMIIVTVLSVRFALFAYRNRSKAKRSWIASATSFLGSFISITIWMIVGAVNIAYVLLLGTLAQVSPPVNVMLSDVLSSGQQSLVHTDDGVVVNSLQNGMYSWACPQPEVMTHKGADVSLNERDQLVLQKLCIRPEISED